MSSFRKLMNNLFNYWLNTPRCYQLNIFRFLAFPGIHFSVPCKSQGRQFEKINIIYIKIHTNIFDKIYNFATR